MTISIDMYVFIHTHMYAHILCIDTHIYIYTYTDLCKGSGHTGICNADTGNSSIIPLSRPAPRYSGSQRVET